MNADLLGKIKLITNLIITIDSVNDRIKTVNEQVLFDAEIS